jgi:hypothetical protein
MSALLPITDSSWTPRHVRFVPNGDIARQLEMKEAAN